MYTSTYGRRGKDTEGRGHGGRVHSPAAAIRASALRRQLACDQNITTFFRLRASVCFSLSRIREALLRHASPLQTREFNRRIAYITKENSGAAPPSQDSRLKTQPHNLSSSRLQRELGKDGNKKDRKTGDAGCEYRAAEPKEVAFFGISNNNLHTTTLLRHQIHST